MLSKAKIKFLQSLQHKKFRQLYHRFVVDGDKTVRELLASGFHVETVYAEPWWFKKFKEHVENVSELIEVSNEELQKISTQQTPNGVVAVAEIPVNERIELNRNCLVLALDNISDPGNLGTIVRIADWFALDGVVCSENCVDAFNPKVVNAAKGSLFRVKVFYTGLNDFFSENKSNVYAAMLSGESIYKADISSQGVILIGSEAHGISAELLPFVTKTISIPSFGKAESLNAGVAAGIICSEFKRRGG